MRRSALTDAVCVLLRGLLTGEAMTYDTLVERSGLKKPTLARWVKANRARLHIASWAPDKNGRPFLPVFKWGVAEDVPRPGRAFTSAEYMRLLRIRRKAETTEVAE